MWSLWVWSKMNDIKWSQKIKLIKKSFKKLWLIDNKALCYNFSFSNSLSKRIRNLMKVIKLSWTKIITSFTGFYKFFNQVFKQVYQVLTKLAIKNLINLLLTKLTIKNLINLLFRSLNWIWVLITLISRLLWFFFN